MIFNNVVWSQAITCIHIGVTRDSVRMEQKDVIYSSELPQSSYKLSGSTLVLNFIRFSHNSTKLTFFLATEDYIYLSKTHISHDRPSMILHGIYYYVNERNY